MAIEKPLFLLGIPTRGMHSYLFTQFLQGTAWPTNFSLLARWVPGLEVGRARNILAQEAINTGAKYLMFIDEDVIGPGRGIRTLLYHMENHPDWAAVGGVYATKTFPPEPLIFMENGQGPYWGWKQGELLRVNSSGMGFHLLRVSDLANMKGPEPYEDRNPWTGAVMPVRQWFKTDDVTTYAPNSAIERVLHTEDSWFYAFAKEEGLSCWVDTNVQCGHYDKETGLMFLIPQDNQTAVRPDAFNASPCRLNLGAGGMYDPYEVSVDLRADPHITYHCDIRKLPDDWENHFDYAHADHVLEHFSFGQVADVLKEWVRVIKPGGKLCLRVPDIEWASLQVVANKDINTYLQGCIYGDQGHYFWGQPPYGGDSDRGFLPHSYDHNYHKSGFTVASLARLMHAAGLVDVEGERRGFEFEIRGTKPITESNKTGKETEDATQEKST